MVLVLIPSLLLLWAQRVRLDQMDLSQGNHCAWPLRESRIGNVILINKEGHLIKHQVLGHNVGALVHELTKTTLHDDLSVGVTCDLQHQALVVLHFLGFALRCLPSLRVACLPRLVFARL